VQRLRRYAFAAGVLAIVVVLGAYGSLRVAMAYIGDPPLNAAAYLLPAGAQVHHGPGKQVADKPRLLVEPEDVDPLYLAMLLSFEDRRFYSHFGVDLFALARSALELVQYRRIVSGGSTLTMQVARILENQYRRAPAVKARQILRALQLEQQFSKREILRLYLNLAPFGGRIQGVRAASLAYFGKEPQHLTVGEAALLVALPQAPELRRLDRYADKARRARDFVLTTVVAAGVLSPAEAELARLETVIAARREPAPSLISFGE
jgi:penicillin-binding protein 1C